MVEIRRITQQEEAEMPAFENHEAAIRYFEEKYGEKFSFEESSDTGKGICFFYRLIIDEPAYIRGISELNSTGNIALGFLKSCQSVQIMEDGSLEITYD